MLKVKANLNPEYEIKETDQKYIHVVVATRIHFPQRQTYEDNEKVIIFLGRNEYESFKNNYQRMGYVKVEVIHDPDKVTQSDEFKTEKTPEQPAKGRPGRKAKQ